MGFLDRARRRPAQRRLLVRHLRGAGPAVRQGPRHGRLLLSGEVHLRPLRRAGLRPEAEARHPALADDLHPAVVPLRPRGQVAHLPARDGRAGEHQGRLPQGAGRLRRAGHPLRRAASSRSTSRSSCPSSSSRRCEDVFPGSPSRRRQRAVDAGFRALRDVQRAAAREVARGARVVRARGPAVPDGAGAAVPHGSRHRPRDRGRPAGLRLSDPLGAVPPDRRRPAGLGVRRRHRAPATSSRRSTSATSGRRPTASTPTRSCGAPRSPRACRGSPAWSACRSYECGMDQPTYTPVQQIVERSGTLFFSFQDLDSTKPAGSVKIRVETITHYLSTLRRPTSSRRRRRPRRPPARSRCRPRPASELRHAERRYSGRPAWACDRATYACSCCSMPATCRRPSRSQAAS